MRLRNITLLRSLPLLNILSDISFCAAADEIDRHPIPSALQAASIAKQILHDASTGVVMVRSSPRVFGDDFADFPYGQIELIAQDCETRKDVLLFSSPMELTYNSWDTYHNQVALHVREEVGRKRGEDPLVHKRFTLQGHVEKLPTKKEDPDVYRAISTCFFAKHPDARSWENLKSHAFRFFRFVPKKIHYVGGFGDTHYIGFIKEHLWDVAPDSKKCSAWPKCHNNTNGDENCCPYDSDNAMQVCCTVDDADIGRGDVDEVDGGSSVLKSYLEPYLDLLWK